MSATASNPRAVIRKLNIAGFAVMIVMVGGFGGWAATAELSGAVVTSGTLVVESAVKKVQHPTGGVVGELLVKQGAAVEAGQIVMRLDDTVTRSTLGVVRSQLDELMAREARLLAEREGADAVDMPAELTARRGEKAVNSAVAGELKLFEARRTGRSGQRSQLRERIGQSREEIVGLSALQQAKEREIAHIDDELIGVNELWKKQLVPMSRLKMLEREKARLEGERGQYIADIARARGKISETELQILQLDQDFMTEVLKDLRDSQGRIAELKERLTAAEDQLKRIDIRAPQAGVVHQLSVHTVGGVIAAGDTVMQIVPDGDNLVVEAKVAPQDIDQIEAGAAAHVRIMAGNQRTAPDLNATVTLVSADLTHDPPSGAQPGAAYYLIRLSLPPAEIRKLDGLKLVPGMPAEVYVQTYARTPLEYLLKPLHDQIARTFRER
ncbi:MAG: HlyD family type I secretion periplasmic adaptor subunit [Enhydrobacter sp.]|nr:HlyD family type I secretion periplasmic adaptor subunit [Enhydrobacter sp.]